MSGVGAQRIGFDFLKKLHCSDVVYLSSPTWGKHTRIRCNGRFYSVAEVLASLARKVFHLVREPILTLSLPRVINIKLLLQPQRKYYITQYEELNELNDSTADSLTSSLIHCLSKGLGEHFLNLGVKGLNLCPWVNGSYVELGPNVGALQLPSSPSLSLSSPNSISTFF